MPPRSRCAPKPGGARVKDLAFRVAMLLCVALSVIVLATLIVDVLIDALPVLGSRLFMNFPSSNAWIAGLQPAIFGTLWIIGEERAHLPRDEHRL